MLIFYQNLVVLARGFHEASLLLDRIAPPGYLPDPFLRTVRFLPFQSRTGKAF